MPVAANQKLAGVTEKDKETTGFEMNLSTNKRLAPVKLDGGDLEAWGGAPFGAV